MLPTEPLALYHSWPIFDQRVRFPHGVLDTGRTPELSVDGGFSYDMGSGVLSWNAETFALFGLPVENAPRREAVLPLFETGSRSALERLRAHAIRHRRGFTIDTEVNIPTRGARHLRITAMPDLQDGRVVTLRGLHQDVTHEYR